MWSLGTSQKSALQKEPLTGAIQMKKIIRNIELKFLFATVAHLCCRITISRNSIRKHFLIKNIDTISAAGYNSGVETMTVATNIHLTYEPVKLCFTPIHEPFWLRQTAHFFFLSYKYSTKETMLITAPMKPDHARIEEIMYITPFEKNFPRGLYTRLHSALAG